MPHIFKSPLTGRYYYALKVKDLGNGNFMAIGHKVDVTEEMYAIIDEAVRSINEQQGETLEQAISREWGKRGMQPLIVFKSSDDSAQWTITVKTLRRRTYKGFK